MASETKPSKKNAPRPTLKGALRGKALSGRELREAVTTACKQEFLGRFGTAWPSHLTPPDPGAVADATAARARTERDAARVLGDLRTAMLAAVNLATDLNAPRGPRGGECAAFLAWWVPKFIEPLTRHAALQPDPAPEPAPAPEKKPDPLPEPERRQQERLAELPPTERERLIVLWTSVNLWDPTSDRLVTPESLAQGQPARVLSPRDLALVTLLSGQWPSSATGAHTVAEVISREEKAIRKLLERGWSSRAWLLARDEGDSPPDDR